MSSHLVRRGGVWWVRFVVPERLRNAAGRREFCQSTRTCELAIAKLVCASFLASWRLQILHLESRPLTTDVLKLVRISPVLSGGGYVSIAESVRETGIGQAQLLRAVADGGMGLFCRLPQTQGYIVARDALDRNDAGSVDIPQPQHMPDSAIQSVRSGIFPIGEDSAAVADAVLAGGRESVDLVAFELAGQPGMLFVPDVVVTIPAVDFGAIEVLAVEVEAMRQRLALSVSPMAVKQAQALQKAALQGSTQSVGEKAHELFSVAVEKYTTDSNGLPGQLSSETELRQRKKGLLLFSEFMGDLPLDKIDSHTLRSFRDGPLRTIPARANTLPKELKRDTMKETIKAISAAGIDWPLLSLEMRHERLRWLGGLFGWLKTKQWLKEDLFAPLIGESGLTKTEHKELKRVSELDDEGRGSFTDPQLKDIFNQPCFELGHGKHVSKPEYWYPFQFWLPLLGLYAGCRIKEASQLYLSDVMQTEDGVWCLDINQNTRDKSLKNDQSKRLIPLSQVLIDLGFLAYCERLKTEGFRRVFPELSWSKSDAKYAKETGRKMSAMLKSLGMPRDSMHVFHCLRHNMNNALERVPLSALSFEGEGLKRYIRYTVLGHIPGKDANTVHYTKSPAKERLTLINGLAYGLPPIAKFDIDFGIGQVRVAIKGKKGFRRGREDMGPMNESRYPKST